jgi:hypothetical protein
MECDTMGGLQLPTRATVVVWREIDYNNCGTITAQKPNYNSRLRHALPPFFFLFFLFPFLFFTILGKPGRGKS